jgi:hypothetical protein
MKGDYPKETIHGNMLENFNLMQFRCIRCSSNELTKSTSTFLQKVVEDKNIICEEIFQVNDINQQFGLYVIACLTYKKCNNRISVTVLDHGKMKQ